MVKLISAAVAETPCCKIGQFIAKGGCFALRDEAGSSVWLEIDPVPLHLLDEEVEIVGQQFGTDVVWVEWIGPVGGRADRSAHNADPIIIARTMAHIRQAR